MAGLLRIVGCPRSLLWRDYFALWVTLAVALKESLHARQLPSDVGRARLDSAEGAAFVLSPA